jgi:hypothetical protein
MPYFSVGRDAPQVIMIPARPDFVWPMAWLSAAKAPLSRVETNLEFRLY